MTHQLYHKHLILTARLRNPPRTAEAVHDWLVQIVNRVGMEILFGPYTTRCDIEGNEGVTGVVCITTSHCSCHVWDTLEEPFMKFDLYSCRDFMVDDVIDLLKQFDPYGVDFMVLDRNDTGQRMHVAASGYLEDLPTK